MARAAGDEGLSVRAIAATSAGAEVAAPFAAGYRTEERAEAERPGSNIVTRRTGRQPVRLLRGWWRLRVWTWTRRHVRLALANALVCAAAVAMHRGLFSTRPMVAVLDRALSRNVAAADRRVTFADLARAGLPDLAIIATDITTASPVVFDRHNHPDVAVADAVAASIAVPFLLRPKSLPLAPVSGPPQSRDARSPRRARRRKRP